MQRQNGLFTILEQLESRRLLSGATLGADGMLLVSGTNKADKIYISMDVGDASKLDVSINGEHHSFNVADVKGVKVYGKNGRDRIKVVEDNGAIDVNCSMFGGNGKDRLIGGSGDDSLDGGNGKDELFGGKGDDTEFGANGDDHLRGDDGDDHMMGGRGDDSLDGGNGDDDMDGGKEHDHVRGDAGNDDF